MSDKSDYNRPRRPDPATISYLRSLPLDLDLAREEIKTYQAKTIKNSGKDNDSDEHDYPISLAAALQAIYEIHNELASLAGEEHAAEAIEILCHITIPVSRTAGRVFLDAVRTYGLHLSTHRYGSHVLQTILQLTAKCGDDDLALREQAPPLLLSDLPALPVTLLGLVDELEPSAVDLATHICGSHVLRTIICVLGGVEVKRTRQMPLRRGKLKKKKKKRRVEPPDGNSGHNDDGHVACIPGFSPDGELSAALDRLSKKLLQTPDGLVPGNLQRLACHSSAGPVLNVLLQVLTYQHMTAPVLDKQRVWEEQSQSPDRHLCLTRPQPVYKLYSSAHKMVQKLLCWNPDCDPEKQPQAGDVIYGFAGEPRGSHCLELCLRLSPNSVYSGILLAGKFMDQETLKEYVEDSVSNFVVQTLLTSVRDQQQAAGLIEALRPLIVSGMILKPENKRNGILWRLVELAASNEGQRHQAKVIKMLRQGFTTLSFANESSGVSNHREVELKWNKCIPELLSVKRPERDGDRAALDVAAVRSLFYFLRFEPDMCKDTLKGIFELSADTFEILAKDALGSRCILDGILEGPVRNSIFANALKRLLAKLEGRWVALSIDRVGHHTVKKLFLLLSDIEDRETLVSELVAGKNRMRGNSMGRSVLNDLEVQVFETGDREEWSRLTKKKSETAEWLNGMGSNNDSHTSQPGTKSKKRNPSHLQLSIHSKKTRGSGDIDSIIAMISGPGKSKS